MNIPLDLRLATDLLRNMALLMALIFVYSVFRSRLLGLPAIYRDLVTGILFGLFALLATPISSFPRRIHKRARHCDRDGGCMFWLAHGAASGGYHHF
ncbi:MAG: hypothetical protein H7175_24285 [Burkholderiales bacterium]|nr:hypothetical protein [Anaerolineae bacterium]